MCPLREFLVYKPVADSSDVVIRRRGFSIVGTHEPAIAMPPPSSYLHTVLFYPQRNQIYLVGRHQGVRRFVSPGLHHNQVSQQSLQDPDRKDIRRLGLVRFFRVWRRLFAICKSSKRWPIGIDVPERLGNGGEARAAWGVWQGDRKTGTVASGAI